MLRSGLRVVTLAVVGLTTLPAYSSAQAENGPSRIVVDGIPMRIWTSGVQARQPGQPVLVLEAGAGGTLDSWQPMLGKVAELAPTVAYDRRGRGQSEADTAPQTLERVARSLHALLREARVAPPYVLTAASWAVAFVKEFAALYPAEVAGFVFLDVTDIDVTREETARLPRGATEHAFGVPEILVDTPPGLAAEFATIAANVRTEFRELRALKWPENVAIAVVVAGGDPQPGVPTDAAAALLRLRIQHQLEWVLRSPSGLMLVSRKAGHRVYQDDPALVLRAISHVLQNASSRPAR
jgi:pimeloyl-ACP methyl ester carboxylesterase